MATSSTLASASLIPCDALLEVDEGSWVDGSVAWGGHQATGGQVVYFPLPGARSSEERLGRIATPSVLFISQIWHRPNRPRFVLAVTMREPVMAGPGFFAETIRIGMTTGVLRFGGRFLR